MLEERIQAAQAMILEEKREKSMKRGQVYYQITLSLDVTSSHGTTITNRVRRRSLPRHLSTDWEGIRASISLQLAGSWRQH